MWPLKNKRGGVQRFNCEEWLQHTTDLNYSGEEKVKSIALGRASANNREASVTNS